MKKIPPQNCEFYGKTITRIHFSDPGELPPRTKIITDDQTVEANLLIQGKLQNNLYIDPLPKSKTESVHVYVQQPMEEQYFSYIEKLSNGDYRNAFEDKNVTTTEREKIIRNKLAELKRTNYQISHCRPEHGIVSINTMKRNAIRNGVKPKDWLIDTTHQVIINNIFSFISKLPQKLSFLRLLFELQNK